MSLKKTEKSKSSCLCGCNLHHELAVAQLFKPAHRNISSRLVSLLHTKKSPEQRPVGAFLSAAPVLMASQFQPVSTAKPPLARSPPSA